MKKILLLAILGIGIISSCTKGTKQTDWKVEITSTENIEYVNIKSADIDFNENLMTTTSFTKEFKSSKAGGVGVICFGAGTITIKIYKKGEPMKEKSGEDNVSLNH